MAYIREEKEKLEIDYPVEKVWAATTLAVKVLQWITLEIDEATRKLKVKTKGGFMSYGSILCVEVSVVDEKTSRMVLRGETPVTTITAMADFGRTRDRIELLVDTLAKILEAKPVAKKSDQNESSN